MRFATRCFVILLALAGSTAHAAAITVKGLGAYRSGQYWAMPDGILKASWDGGAALVKDVLGTQGENTRTLVRFNGRAALHYDAVASGHPYEAYFTLAHNKAGLVVDCIYASIRDGMTGALIAKAVCGLEAPLNSGYTDLLSSFEEQWRKQLQPNVFRGGGDDPGRPVRVVDANLRGVEVIRVYASIGELTTQWPETRISLGARSRSLGRQPVYLVYDRSSLTTPVALEVARGDESEPFQLMDYGMLAELLMPNTGTDQQVPCHDISSCSPLPANTLSDAPANLCVDSVALFQCDTRGGKQIVMCGGYDADGELTGLQYRFGRGPSPELIYPAQLKQSLGKFRSNHYFRYQTDYSQISFDNGSYTYSVYSHYDGEGSPGNSKVAGVTVTTQAGARVAEIKCKAIRKDGLQQITAKVACDADQALGCS